MRVRSNVCTRTADHENRFIANVFDDAGAKPLTGSWRWLPSRSLDDVKFHGVVARIECEHDHGSSCSSAVACSPQFAALCSYVRTVWGYRCSDIANVTGASCE